MQKLKLIELIYFTGCIHLCICGCSDPGKHQGESVGQKKPPKRWWKVQNYFPVLCSPLGLQFWTWIFIFFLIHTCILNVWSYAISSHCTNVCGWDVNVYFDLLKTKGRPHHIVLPASGVFPLQKTKVLHSFHYISTTFYLSASYASVLSISFPLKPLSQSKRSALRAAYLNYCWTCMLHALSHHHLIILNSLSKGI